jgi:hypothetical protein
MSERAGAAGDAYVRPIYPCPRCMALSSQLCNMEDCTAIEIDVRSLTTHQVAPDGSDICLNIENAGGRPICVKGAELLRRAAGPEVDTTHAEPEASTPIATASLLPDRKRPEVAKALATLSRRSHGRRVKSPPFRDKHQTKRGVRSR